MKTNMNSLKEKNHMRHDLGETDPAKYLMGNHEMVKELFKEYGILADRNVTEGKVLVANQICAELTVHTEAEEAFIYPLAETVINNETVLKEAKVMHLSAGDLIAQIQSMDPKDPLLDAKVFVLGKYIEYCFAQEERGILPTILDTSAVVELGIELKAREAALLNSLSDADGSTGPKKLKAATAKMIKH
ncbi:MAG: hemerythrin domain-containing protein [Methylophilaceae bacterium]